MTLLTKRSNHTPNMRINRRSNRLLQQRLSNVKVRTLPRLARLTNHRKIRLHLAPRITKRLPKRTTRNGDPLRALIFRRHNLLLSNQGNRNRTHTPRLLLHARVIRRSYRRRTSLPTRTMRMTTTTSLRNSKSHRHHDSSLIVFLDSMSVFHPNRLFRDDLSRLNTITTFFLPRYRSYHLVQQLRRAVR